MCNTELLSHWIVTQWFNSFSSPKIVNSLNQLTHELLSPTHGRSVSVPCPCPMFRFIYFLWNEHASHMPVQYPFRVRTLSVAGFLDLTETILLGTLLIRIWKTRNNGNSHPIYYYGSLNFANFNCTCSVFELIITFVFKIKFF